MKDHQRQLIKHRQLIEEIAREVVRRVCSPPRLLMVYNNDANPEDLDLAKAALQHKWQVELHTADAAPDDTLTSVHMVYFFHMDQDFIVRGALGLTDTVGAAVLAQALQSDIPVFIQVAPSLEWMFAAHDERDSLSTGAKRYRDYLLQQVRTLLDFGVTFGTLADLAKLKPGDRQGNQAIWHFTGQLLTQRALQETEAKTIVVSPSVIITPLARDTARERGIKLLVSKDEVGQR
ncbi:hypothetical protein J2S00_001512 [Caldalkalibacillus uzonensis]|uniref:Ethanolamine utilization protein n=1 Tax=Caldalkalibacillus uzonensis TaxID=353224 RepID=A0ABU0CQP0_9BACI|nr:hypothetical protein [Caldalkalibacillus uzonensis]MDQ0338726.1 hypothetical protein [Caldalkalibacillus uzonensis]